VTRPRQFTSVYLDSCVLIRHILDGPSNSEVGAVFRLIENGVLTAWIGGVHWVEVLGKQRSEAFDQSREDLAQSLLTHPDLHHVDVGPYVLREARQYALHRGFKPMDAIHIASAVAAEVDVFLTFDEKLPHFGSRIDGVWVDFPYEPGEPPLF
jgi:predicted nucleic acid-binding protein